MEHAPDLVALCCVYLSARLLKVDVEDWHGKLADFTGPWYTDFVRDGRASVGVIKGEQ